MKTIDALPLRSGQKVFCRVDFNVPLDANRHVTDDTRIKAALPTIRYLLEKGCIPICASHLGRPDGKVVAKYRLDTVGAALERLLDHKYKVYVTDAPVGGNARTLISDRKPNEIVLLENLRFNPGEENNDPAFAKELASYADAYVNDAFGTAHRAHASTVGIVKQFPGGTPKGAGFLMAQEVSALSKLVGPVEHPYVAILGGAKVSDKIGVLEKLIDLVDVLLIGGAMANTFIKARGGATGNSRVETDKIAFVQSLLHKADAAKKAIVLPSDVVIAESIEAESVEITAADRVREGMMALDIGPETCAAFAKRISTAKTVFWNGPMGVFEKPAFSRGTHAIAEAVAQFNGFSVVGGGDSVAAINQCGVADAISHISTGGGASLEFIESGSLPGVDVLRD